MALLPGSPAIDAGDNTGAPDFDQRGPGFPRIVNGIIDIGAFEVQAENDSPAIVTGRRDTNPSLLPTQPALPSSLTVAATVSADGSSAVSSTQSQVTQDLLLITSASAEHDPLVQPASEEWVI
jgi:hypothetical protein